MASLHTAALPVSLSHHLMFSTPLRVCVRPAYNPKVSSYGTVPVPGFYLALATVDVTGLTYTPIAVATTTAQSGTTSTALTFPGYDPTLTPQYDYYAYFIVNTFTPSSVTLQPGTQYASCYFTPADVSIYFRSAASPSGTAVYDNGTPNTFSSTFTSVQQITQVAVFAATTPVQGVTIQCPYTAFCPVSEDPGIYSDVGTLTSARYSTQENATQHSTAQHSTRTTRDERRRARLALYCDCSRCSLTSRLCPRVLCCAGLCCSVPCLRRQLRHRSDDSVNQHRCIHRGLQIELQFVHGRGSNCQLQHTAFH